MRVAQQPKPEPRWPAGLRTTLVRATGRESAAIALFCSLPISCRALNQTARNSSHFFTHQLLHHPYATFAAQQSRDIFLSSTYCTPASKATVSVRALFVTAQFSSWELQAVNRIADLDILSTNELPVWAPQWGTLLCPGTPPQIELLMMCRMHI